MAARNLIGGLVAEGAFVANALRARGVRHYGRALAVAAALTFVPYRFAYQGGAERLKRINMELEAAEATARYADTYQSLQTSWAALSARLPPADGAEAWVLQTVRESMKAKGIVPQSLSPVTGNDEKDFRYLSVTVSFHAHYKDIADWIASLESSRRVLHVSSLIISKELDPIGQNSATVTLSCMVPRVAVP